MHADKLHLAGGVSIAAAKMNILDCNGFGLLRLFRGRCRVGIYFGKQALFVTDKRKREKVIIFVGGGRSSDAKLIKGNSFGSAYVSEVNECNKEFFFEVLDRTLASSDKKLFFDLNPKPQSHWFYREFLDWHDERLAAGEEGYQHAHFTIADNLSVSDERLREVLGTYDKKSVWYQSEILGRRVLAAGHIFEGLDKQNIFIDEEIMEKMQFGAFAIGVDVGGTDATVATLVGYSKGFKEACVIDGYYHKQGRGSGFTHDRYAKEIATKIVGWSERFPEILYNCVCFCESADKLFRQALSNELRAAGLSIRVVPSYKKDGILDRIRLVAMLIAQGRFKIAAHLGMWLAALESAAWDENAMNNGEWVRIDDGSGVVDILDSTEYAIQPFKGRLV